MAGLFTAHHAKIWQVQFYRSEYGDAGYAPVPLFEKLDEEEMKALLIDRFTDPRKGYLPATQADVLDDNGELVMRVRRTFGDKVEVVPHPAPPSC